MDRFGRVVPEGRAAMTRATDDAGLLALLVVADPPLRERCRDLLSAAGLAVAEGIESGAAAVVVSRELAPDVIVLCRQLADVAAPEAVTWLRSNPQSATTPIIVIGRKGRTKIAEAFVTMLPRAFTAAQFREALATALEKTPPTKGTTTPREPSGS
jgi:DNA-binding response OmpR family regulator